MPNTLREPPTVQTAPGEDGTAVRSAIGAAAAGLEPVSLEQLGQAALLDRVDTRFLVPAALVPELLRRCAADYRVLEVERRRLFRYATCYYDTPDLAFYHAHHGGRLPRRKVRVRSYLDEDLHYLEVKVKTNKGRTVKLRVRLRDGLDESMRRLRRRLPADVVPLLRLPELREVLRTSFYRLTLVRRAAPERVTIDFLLELSSRRGGRSYPAVAIVEVKQERHGRSPVQQLMRELGQRPGGISKYCLGVVSLEDGARKNRFQRVLHFIAKTGEQHVALESRAS